MYCEFIVYYKFRKLDNSMGFQLFKHTVVCRNSIELLSVGVYNQQQYICYLCSQIMFVLNFYFGPSILLLLINNNNLEYIP